jgi:hypothetical protein
VTIDRVLDLIGLDCVALCATNNSHRKQETFLYEYLLHLVLLPIKNAQPNSFSAVIHTSSTINILTTHISLWTCACESAKLDCHEAGLCCYLVVHIENLQRTLQLFYYHLWSIYWLSIIHLDTLVQMGPSPVKSLSRITDFGNLRVCCGEYC